MKNKPTRNITILNRKAKFDYHFIDTWVAGMELQGTEVKSIREGRCNLVDAYCYFHNNELFVTNMEIPTSKNAFQHEPKRLKKLLLKRTELNKIERALDEGTTIIPIRIFELRGIFKMEIALARGKKLYDKRESIKERDVKREIERNRI